MTDLLVVTPDELCFPPPLDKVIACILKLRNPTSDATVAFKVKTTAPKRYCVRPNAGVVNPGETVEVQILLQPIPNPPEDPRTKDKFLVQSVRVDPRLVEASASGTHPWPASKEGVSEVKLRCYFQSPEARAEQRQQASSASSAAAANPANPGITNPANPGAVGAPPASPAGSDYAHPPVTARGHVAAAPSPPRDAAAAVSSANPVITNPANLDKEMRDMRDTLVRVSKDRDQLHDTLAAAANKLEDVQRERDQLDARLREAQARAASAPAPGAGSTSTSSENRVNSSGFSLLFVLLVCIAFLVVGALLGASYGPEWVHAIAGAAAAAGQGAGQGGGQDAAGQGEL